MTSASFKCSLLSASLASCATLALAQDPPAPSNNLIGLSLYGLNLSEISPEIEESVAIWANPIIVTIPEGQTPREAAARACPNASDVYWDVFERLSKQWNPHLPGGFDINMTLNGSQIALAPNCIQNHSQVVTIGRGEWLSRDIANDYLSELEANTSSVGRVGSVAVQNFSESVAILNNRNLSSLNNLQEGEELLIPLPRADFITSAEGANAISEAVRNSLDEGSVAIGEPSFGRGGSLTVSPADAPEAPHPGSCSGQSEGALLKVHSAAFSENYEAIFWNMNEARQIGGGRTPAKSSVAILDTGLPDTEWWNQGSFVKPVEKAPSETLFVPEPLRRDFFPSFQKLWSLHAPIALTEIVNRTNHTEAVLGAAMGGYYGYLFNSSFGVIEPRVFSIFSLETDYSNPIQPVFYPEKARIKMGIEAVIEADRPFIVNISAGTPNDQHGEIRRALDSTRNGVNLFVVAAGNSGENPETDLSELYPANYGGVNAADLPLITVGGYQRNPEAKIGIWAESNRGTHVDILALGCDVQTVKFAKNSARNLVTLEHHKGTSLAAPRVTFVAAVIKHLMSHKKDLDGIKNLPMLIKNRILSSADLHFELRNDVVDGRIMNLAKAVNLFSDLVETSDGEFKRGTVMFDSGNSEFNICRDTARVAPANIRKIATWQQTGDDVYKFYYTKPNRIELYSCTDFRAPRMSFVDQSGEADPIQLVSFKDVVFAMPKF